MLNSSVSQRTEVNDSEAEVPVLPRGVQWGHPLTAVMVRALRAAPETDVRHATRDRLQGYGDGLREARALIYRVHQSNVKSHKITELLRTVERLEREVATQLDVLCQAEVAPRLVVGSRALPCQDPNYSIRFNRLVIADSGESIPRSEPILILRASTTRATRAALYEQFALDHPYAKPSSNEAE